MLRRQILPTAGASAYVLAALVGLVLAQAAFGWGMGMAALWAAYALGLLILSARLALRGGTDPFGGTEDSDVVWRHQGQGVMRRPQFEQRAQRVRTHGRAAASTAVHGTPLLSESLQLPWWDSGLVDGWCADPLRPSGAGTPLALGQPRRSALFTFFASGDSPSVFHSFDELIEV